MAHICPVWSNARHWTNDIWTRGRSPYVIVVILHHQQLKSLWSYLNLNLYLYLLSKHGGLCEEVPSSYRISSIMFLMDNRSLRRAIYCRTQEGRSYSTQIRHRTDFHLHRHLQRRICVCFSYSDLNFLVFTFPP